MSDVFFTNLRIDGNYNLLDKLERLVTAAGLNKLDLDKKFTALKMHFGEPGNLAYLRPHWAARIVKMLKGKGAKVFLTDSNTLYKGRRANAVDHIESAFENGYYPLAVGCPVLIADGLKGLEYREIEINQKNCKTAKIGSAIADADVFISLNHFKGHEMTGFGGSLKNIGMGSGSIGGKLEMHSASKPKIVIEKCTGCKICEKNCNHDAVHVINKKAVIDYAKCVGCGQCIAVCNYEAASVDWNEAGITASEKISEYCLAVLKGKQHFHINFVMNVSPNCDCWNLNDQAIVPDIGILASFDPVALDQASVDLVNKSIASPDCVVSDLKAGDDKFTKIFPNTNWSYALEYAEKVGLGQRAYKLTDVK